MKTATDEQLLARHLSGETGAFAVLVERHADELYRFLARFIGSRSLAEDLVQEVFLQVYQVADRFDASRRFKPWLFTIAANKARDLMRGRRRRPEVPFNAQVEGGQKEGQIFLDFLADAAAGPVERLEEQEEKDLVRQVLNALPDHLREVLILSYYHQFAYKEIAEMLQIPLGTVKSRLHAAVGRFGQMYRVLSHRHGEGK